MARNAYVGRTTRCDKLETQCKTRQTLLVSKEALQYPFLLLFLQCRDI